MGPSKAEYDHLFKLLLIGDSKVGKTSFLSQFQSNEFFTNYTPTIGVDFAIKTVDIGDSKVKLQIWDTAGDDRFISIVTAYFRGAHGIILMFDITSKNSFDNVSKWVKLAQQHGSGDVKMILVGNKVDMEHERQVELVGAEGFASDLGVPYYEVSSKIHSNVIEAVSFLTAKIHGTMAPDSLVQERKSTPSVGSNTMYPANDVEKEKEDAQKADEDRCCCIIM